MIDNNHKLVNAEQRCSPFFNARPVADDISLLVIHCISLPRGSYGQPFIDQLFCGQLDCDCHQDFTELQGLEVSAHLLINREGRCIQYVPFDQRAWHAGVSSFQGRCGCNDYSIGIELEGVDDEPFTDEQYRALIRVTLALLKRYPKLSPSRIVGHSDIAPGRKSDPGSGFDWVRFRTLIKTK